MFLKLVIIWLLKSAIAEEINKIKCIEESSFDFNACGMPPILNQMRINIDALILCTETKFFIDCMEDTIGKLCPYRINKTSPLERKLRPAIDLHKKMFIENNCTKIEKNATLIEATTEPSTLGALILVGNARIGVDFDFQSKETANTSFSTTEKTYEKSSSVQVVELSTTSPKTETTSIPTTEITTRTTKATFKTTTSGSNEYEKECEVKSCKPTSLHITCGYPAANPQNNIHAFCKEFSHYIHCAKCKIASCGTDEELVAKKQIGNQESVFKMKCYPKTSEITKSQQHTTIREVKTTTEQAITSTTTTEKALKTEIEQTTQSVVKITTAVESTKSSNPTSKQRLDLSYIANLLNSNDKSRYSTLGTPYILTQSESTSENEMITETIPAPNSLKTSYEDEDLSSTRLAEITEFTKMNFTVNEIASTDIQTTLEVEKSSMNSTNETIKIDRILINFDHIDINNNTVKVLTSVEDRIFYLNLINKTDIFKGVKDGAIYMHSKTAFVLDLAENIEDFCITNANYKKKDSVGHFSDACGRGWSIVFWIKVSNINLFDKTIIKVDTFSNKAGSENRAFKYLIIRISNFDIRIQFLYNRKLWSINQSVLWKSEWSLLTFTWHEYDGLNIYINEKKVVYQQTFEYYNYQSEMNKKASQNDEINGEFINNTLISEDTNESEIDLQSIIYMGLNNKIENKSRKKFWGSSQESNNILFTTAYAEAILLDNFEIYNYVLNAKDILESYLKEYTIRTEYDSVSEIMYLSSDDGKQSELQLMNGASAKRFKDNWFITLNGFKEFASIPNLIDSCLADIEGLCDFGFSITLWIKFTYNFLKYPIQNSFEQSLFFIGSHDFLFGIEAFFTISSNSYESFTPTYDYILTLNLKTETHAVVKNFKIYLSNINDLSKLNCITIQSPNIQSEDLKIHLHWLDTIVEEMESSKLSIDSKPSYVASYNTLVNEFGDKTFVPPQSSPIGIFGDVSKQSFFSLQNVELMNYDVSFRKLEYNFRSTNPNIFEFNSLEKLFEIPHVNIHGNPQIVETRFGKSLLFSKSDQRLTFSNVSNSCFGNLNLCPYGYTIRVSLCFTNVNPNTRLQYHPEGSDAKTTKMHILSNGGHKLNSHGIAIIYDVDREEILAYAKTYNKWFSIKADVKIKPYSWYTLTISWDQFDGLRLYVNNRLIEHTGANNYTDSSPETLKTRIYTSDFVIGSFDVNEESDPTYKKINNNPFEFIINKIVQYDVRKYPDEIISKNVVIQEKRITREELTMHWLWYTIIGTFFFIGGIAIVLLFMILKRRTTNIGFWSREQVQNPNVRRLHSFCCNIKVGNDDDELETPKSAMQLELKHCQIEVFRKTINDEQTSHYGTIDRLILNKSVCDSQNGTLNVSNLAGVADNMKSSSIQINNSLPPVPTRSDVKK